MIRIATIELPIFRDVVTVGSAWSKLAEPVSADERACLLANVGRFIRIHPDDVGEIARLGLGLVDDRLVEIVPVELEPAAAGIAPAITTPPTTPTTTKRRKE